MEEYHRVFPGIQWEMRSSYLYIPRLGSGAELSAPITKCAKKWSPGPFDTPRFLSTVPVVHYGARKNSQRACHLAPNDKPLTQNRLSLRTTERRAGQKTGPAPSEDPAERPVSSLRHLSLLSQSQPPRLQGLLYKGGYTLFPLSRMALSYLHLHLGVLSRPSFDYNLSEAFPTTLCVT